MPQLQQDGACVGCWRMPGTVIVRDGPVMLGSDHNGQSASGSALEERFDSASVLAALERLRIQPLS